jgi:8-oxo-dGTP pyrophosphatase MutT (NUDIX family)
MTTQDSILTPAPAATVLLVRDNPFEVLMVRRRSSSFYSSALVFPGGVVETSDRSTEWLPMVRGAEGLDEMQRALRIAACRETHEEAGIVMSSGVVQGALAPGQTFLELVRARGATLDLGGVCPFGHWVTPKEAPKRFDTYFFLCRAPEGAEPVSDGDETVSVEWVEPKHAVARAEAGEHSILFPTLMNLMRLAESTDVESSLAAARVRPIFTVMPRLMQRDGRTFVTIPEEAGYGVTEYDQLPPLGLKKLRGEIERG